MRDSLKEREIAAGAAPFLFLAPVAERDASRQQNAAVSPEIVPALPVEDLTVAAATRSVWVYYPQGLLRRRVDVPDLRTVLSQEEPSSPAHQCVIDPSTAERQKEEDKSSSHSLFQDSFFFCKVNNVGEVPGTGNIYVETVVDRDSGLAFAKVYSARNALNAVDVLASRALPFFEGHGISVGGIYTRVTHEYCGLAPAHPYETFLAIFHIQHLHRNKSTEPDNDLCDHFYTILLNEFLLPALRKKFHLTLEELQIQLDAFVEGYNAKRLNQIAAPEQAPNPAPNFPVDL